MSDNALKRLQLFQEETQSAIKSVRKSLEEFRESLKSYISEKGDVLNAEELWEEVTKAHGILN